MKLTARHVLPLGIIAAIFIAAAGASWAVAADNGPEQIYACANPAGQPRIVDSADDCKKQETSLVWNIVGPAGPQGEQGIQGDQGVQGPQGDTGVDGAHGAPGADGTNGADGADGAPGADGTNGVDGADGIQGLTGDPGLQGDPGPQGPVGPPGPVAGTNGQLVYNDSGTAAGAEAYYDKATGNVGIGTSNPQGKFEVVTGNTVTVALDQYQTTTGNWQPSDSDNWQSFTAGVSGKLTRVDVRWHAPCAGIPFTLSIHAGHGVGGTLMHTQSITGASSTWKALNLTSPLDVAAGDAYTWRVQGSCTPYAGGTALLWKDANPYPGGTSDTSWPSVGDYAFKTYVTSVVPELVVTSEGALIVPRMTTTQRDGLTAVNGMIIYNTSTNQFNFYENGAWVTK